MTTAQLLTIRDNVNHTVHFHFVKDNHTIAIYQNGVTFSQALRDVLVLGWEILSISNDVVELYIADVINPPTQMTINVLSDSYPRLDALKNKARSVNELRVLVFEDEALSEQIADACIDWVHSLLDWDVVYAAVKHG